MREPLRLMGRAANTTGAAAVTAVALTGQNIHKL